MYLKQCKCFRENNALFEKNIRKLSIPKSIFLIPSTDTCYFGNNFRHLVQISIRNTIHTFIYLLIKSYYVKIKGSGSMIKLIKNNLLTHEVKSRFRFFILEGRKKM